MAETLRQILAEPHPNSSTPPETFLRVIRVLIDPGDAVTARDERTCKFEHCPHAGGLSGILRSRQTMLRSPLWDRWRVASASPLVITDRSQRRRKKAGATHCAPRTGNGGGVDRGPVVAPFPSSRVSSRNGAGHKDKTLEYGKDLWMKFTLPTQHVLYFGIQAKKGKLEGFRCKPKREHKHSRNPQPGGDDARTRIVRPRDW